MIRATKIQYDISCLHGLDPSEYPQHEELLHALDAPPDLRRILAVLENFCSAFHGEMLSDVRQVSGLEFEVGRFTAQAKSLLMRMKHASPDEIVLRAPQTTNLRTLFNGHLGEHPFYPLFYVLINEETWFFRWVQQALFILPTLYQQLPNSERHRLSSAERAALGRFFRDMTEHETALLWMQQLTDRSCRSYRDFVGLIKDYACFYCQHHRITDAEQAPSYCTEAKERQHILGRYQRINAAIRNLSIARGQPKIRKTVLQPAGSQAVRKHLLKDGVTPLLNAIHVQLEALPLTDADDDNNDALYSLAQQDRAAPDPDSGEERLEQDAPTQYIFTDSEPLEAYIAAFHGRRLAKALSNRLIRQHQYLPDDHYQLPTAIVCRLLDWLADEKQNPEHQWLVALLFFTGQCLDDLQHIRLKPGKKPPLVLELWPKAGALVLPAFSPRYQSTSAINEVVDRADRLVLPMPALLARITDRYLKSNGQPPASWPLLDTLKAPGTLLTTLSEQLSYPVRFQQLSGHLYFKCCALFGTACATLMFNRPAPGSQARLYYTALPQQVLQQRYQQLLQAVGQDLHCTFDVSDRWSPPPTQQSAYIGCRHLPDAQSYQALLVTLQRKLTELLGGLPGKPEDKRGAKALSLNHWLSFHNLYTAYCVICQSLLTGLRPTHNGFIPLHAMLLEARVAVVRDKDSGDEFHTRTVPLHPKAIQLAQRYQTHTKVVLGRLHRLGLLPHWQKIGSPLPFFIAPSPYATSNVRITVAAFAPSTLCKELSPYFSLPANSPRKFLRSYLELQHVPHHCIDALLGHGNLGEQPWHAHSTLSLQEVRNTLNPVLDKMVRTLGIKAISGLTA